MKGKLVVLLDLDGTIVNSEIVSLRAHRRVLMKYGVHVNLRDLLPKAGRSLKIVSQELISEHRLPLSLKDYIDARSAFQDRMVKKEGVKFMPGAERLIQVLREHDVPMGIVTSSRRTHMEATLAALDIREHFEHTVCREDVEKSKPAPDAYVLARSKFGATHVYVAIEDTDYGVEAAYKARIPVIAVRAMHNAQHRFGPADAVVDLRDTDAVLKVIASLQLRHLLRK